MKVLFSSPVRGLKGKVKEGDLVYYMNQESALARKGAKKTKQVPTSDQATMRQFMSQATQHWSKLSVAERKSWEDYAAVHFSRNAEGDEVIPSGIAAYSCASSMRQILGLPLTGYAPVAPPPQRILKVQQAGPGEPDALGLTIHHGIDDVAGHVVLVRATAATATVARKPKPEEHRLVCGVGPDSGAALPVSGGVVDFVSTRYSINAGQRYGVQVRVIRVADGMASSPVYGDFIKVG